MKKSAKRIVAALLAAVMVLLLLGGCTTGDKPSESSSKPAESSSSKPAESSKPEESSEPEGTGWEAVSALVDIPEIFHKDPAYLEWMDDTSPISISVFYNGLVSDQEFKFDTIVEQKITELTGVTIDGIYDTSNDGSALTLMIASGDKLPDVITNVGMSSVQMMDLIDGGALWAINDLIEQYCPLFDSLIDPYAKGLATDNNGDMWFFPKGLTTSEAEPYFETNGWCAVRGDVCEALGIDPLSIKTLADLDNLLELYTADKDKWPEIKYPILFYALAQGETGNGRPFYNSFGGQLDYNQGLDMIYDKANDSVHFWIEDEYGYNAVKYMWSLAQKGYVDESSFAFTSVFDEVNAGSVLFICGGNQWEVTMNQPTLDENVPGAYYVRTGMLAAEEGQEVFWGDTMYSNWGQGVVITKDCADPERTIKFFEFMQSEYGSTLVLCGIYGEDWDGLEFDDNGTGFVHWLNDDATRSERGAYNYQIDWLNTYGNWDYFASARLNKDPEVANAISYTRFDLYACSPAKIMNTVPADSEYAVLAGQLMPIIGHHQTQMILAKDEAEFDAIYQDCLNALKANRLDEFKEFVLNLTKENNKLLEGYGVKFQ